MYSPGKDGNFIYFYDATDYCLTPSSLLTIEFSPCIVSWIVLKFIFYIKKKVERFFYNIKENQFFLYYNFLKICKI